MTTYELKIKQQIHEVKTAQGYVLSIKPDVLLLGNPVGLRISELCDYATAHGWQIKPVLAKPLSEVLEYHGKKYEIVWNSDRSQVRRIYEIQQDGALQDIPFSKLPSYLKGVL